MEILVFHTSSIANVLNWLYQDGFNPHHMHKGSILASTNEDVDGWNNCVQNMNNNDLVQQTNLQK
jgi:hypothetical protein